MMKFIKKDPVLAAGIFLPIALVAIFFILSEIPKILVPPPQYNLLFSVDEYKGPPLELRFYVENNKLKAEYREAPKQGGNYTRPTLYYYDVKSNNTEEVNIRLPNGTDQWQEVTIDKFGKSTIEQSTTAPDGYKFNPSSWNNGDVFTGIFFNSRYRNNPTITKDGNRIMIPHPDGNFINSYNAKFLGWIVD